MRSQRLPDAVRTWMEARVHRPRRARAGGLAVLIVATLVLTTAVWQLPAQAGPPVAMTGYVPLPADDMQGAMETINAAAGATLDFTVGVTNAAAGAVMYYDEWEDGYETVLSTPAQASTLTFGDGNASNGDAALYCAACTGDLLPQGAALIMRNNVATPRTTPPVLFDGGDKIGSTRGFAITAGGFTTDIGSVLAGVVSAYDTSKYSTDYTVPVGEDTPVPAGTSDAFSYTGIVVQASTDGTVVETDTNADGTVDVTQTIDEGMTAFINGGVNEGATVHSSQPVQVHIATGQRSSSYESRWFALFPDSVLSHDYMSPAGSGVSNFRTVNYLYNPSNTSITVTPSCASCSGTITVPANASAAFHSPLNEAVRFVSANSEPFIAIAGVGAQSGAAPGGGSDVSTSWDWGFTMVPTSQLTTQVVLGWAPGNSNNPPSSPVGDRDDDPVWVTTLTATTLRVDFDGDPSTGAIASADCFGDRHDQDIAVTALASTRIYDANDGDMTGARIYTCDGTMVSGAWGEDPANAPTGSPGFDAGYTIMPTTSMVVDKTAALATDASSDGVFGPGDVIEYNIAIADVGSLAFTSVVANDVLPAGVTYVPNSTELDNGSVVPIADDVAPPAATAFPLDEDGTSLPNVNAGQTVTLRFRASIDDPFTQAVTSIGNTACVDAAETDACDTVTTALAETDLALSKTETASPTHVGDDATFRLTVSNTSTQSATGVEVTDQLPAGTTFRSAAASQGAYDDASGRWTVGTVGGGASATLDITARIDVTSVENFAQITAVDILDTDSQPMENPLGPSNAADQDDEDSIVVNVAPASDLALTKTLTAGPSGPGNTGFTLTLTNDGPNAATNVAVTDYPPAGATYVSSTPSAGSFNSATNRWTVGSIASGGSETLVVTYQLDSFPAQNFAEVTASDQFDPDSEPAENTLGTANPPNQDDEASVSVGAPDADLSLTKAVASAPAFIGDDVTFEIVVSNGGPADATGVTVSDVLPGGLTFVSSSATTGAYNAASGVWTVGTIPDGATATLSIIARLDVPGPVSNTAQITAGNQPDPDSAPNNSVASEDDQATVSGVSAPGATIGDRVWNDADGDGTQGSGETGVNGVTVTLLRDGDIDGSYETTVGSDVTAGDGDYSFGDLPPGAYRVDIAEPSLPAGFVSTTTQPRDVTLAGGQTVSSADFGYRPEADLEVSVIDTGNPVFVGDDAVFVVTVTNRGPAIATGVRVHNVLPAGVTLVSTSRTQGTFDATTGAWTGITLAPDEGAVLTLRVTVDVPTPVADSAQVTASDLADPDSTPANDVASEDDQDSATVDVAPRADLSLDKTETASPVHVGDVATFVLELRNAGPSDATGIEVTDRLPANVSFVSATPAQGTYDAATGVWSVGTLAEDATTTLEISARVDATSVENFAQVTAVAEDDPDSGPAENALGASNAPDQDDEDSVVVTVEPLADLSLSKTSSPATPRQLEQATFTLTVTNDGPSAATGVEVTDRLPAGVEYESSSATIGSYDPTTGVWTIGTLPDGDAATLTIVVRVLDSSAITNTAEVSASNVDDPDSVPGNDAPAEDDLDATTLSPDPLIDLSLTKTASAASANVGSPVTYTIAVTNDGPSGATGVVVRDALPSGTTYVSHTATRGTYDRSSGIWTVGALADDATEELILTAKVATDGEIDNYAEVMDADQSDVDSAPAENALGADDEPDQDDEAEATVTGVPLADLSLAKTAGDATPDLGALVTYKLTLTNHGPSTATGVVVLDKLPAGLTYVRDTSGGAWSPSTGRWSVGSLAGSSSKSIEITARVNAVGDITNTASVLSADQPDPDSIAGNTRSSEDDQRSAKISAVSACVGGVLWVDEDKDGVQDADERVMLSGVTVRLIDEDGTVVASTVTDATGAYQFDELVPGTYTVVVDARSLPKTVKLQSYDPDAVLNGAHVIALVAGRDVTNVDFGYAPLSGTADPGALPRTGAAVGVLVTVSGVLLLVGTAMLLLSRRRPATS